MVCKSCNNGVLEPVSVDEPKDSGRFQEEYKCVNCNARRYISGQEQEDPANWNEWGQA